jgi:Glycosyltransferases involved in cell wall biogenesis
VRWRRATAGNSFPSITAVIPCYNYGRFLSTAVESVLSQDRVSARVIIVDDASTDDSLNVARDLATRDARISVVEHEKNAGHIATYNDGMNRVETDFVLLLSADDFLADGALARATDLMAAEPDVGMVYGLPKEFSEGEQLQTVGPQSEGSWTIFKGREWFWLTCQRGRCFILSPEVVMRTSAMRQVGDYNDELPHSGDLEYWLRTAARWDIGRVNGPVQAYYRSHGANMHLTSYAGMARDLKERLSAFEVLRKEPIASSMRNAVRLHRMAARGVGREAHILALRNLDSGGDAGQSEELLRIGNQASPAIAGGLRARYLALRCRRATSPGNPPQLRRLAEKVRRQIDRVRWILWRRVGIS